MNETKKARLIRKGQEVKSEKESEKVKVKVTQNLKSPETARAVWMMLFERKEMGAHLA